MFLAIKGGSVGYRIGGSSTDLIMLFMNDHALQSLLSDKFKLGADRQRLRQGCGGSLS